jgi:hypothetical protein
MPYEGDFRCGLSPGESAFRQTGPGCVKRRGLICRVFYREAKSNAWYSDVGSEMTQTVAPQPGVVNPVRLQQAEINGCPYGYRNFN